jgi:cytochrome c-type biogenesis protein CcmH/NrfG
MISLPSRYCLAAIPILFVALVAEGRQAGTASSGAKPAGSSMPGQPSGSVSGRPVQQPGLNQPEYQSPLYVNGRILMDSGKPVPESVSVRLECGMRSLQVIYTDLKGNFQFTLGSGPQGNQAMDASADSVISQTGDGVQYPLGGVGQFAGSQIGLKGCEVRVSVPGYLPLSKTITDHAEITGVDVGTLRLTRAAGVAGSSISVISLQVPNDARKEFEKGEKEARSSHFDLAAQHLEKAVAEYDNYAAAWNDLGDVYATDKETEKSRQAFQKAIAADPHYIPPYLGLARLEMQNQEIEPAVETAGKALELDPSIDIANFIQTIGYFKLNRLDDAEKSAQITEKGPHQNMSDLHAVHAQILIQKQDYPDAAAQMRAYLKEVPQGRFADAITKDLQQIEKSEADAGTKLDSAQIAP